MFRLPGGTTLMYADHIVQLQEHAARTHQQADVLVTAYIAAPWDYPAGQAASQALRTAASALHDLSEAVQRAVAASVN